MSDDKWSKLPQHPLRGTQDSPLREKVVQTARSHLGLREDLSADGKYGLNTDKDQSIKKFFVEGVGWRETEWENRKSSDKDESGAKSMWCAAFASYCVAQGYKAEGLPVPVQLHAHGNTLRDNLKKAGLFIPLSEVKSGGRPPQPGDFVIFDDGHTGLVASFNPETKALSTIEGNTYTDNKHRNDGVHELPSISAKRFDKIQGFGITDPGPCLETECKWGH